MSQISGAVPVRKGLSDGIWNPAGWVSGTDTSIAKVSEWMTENPDTVDPDVDVDDAFHRLGELGIRDVHLRLGDGTLGWPEAAPFDKIVVTAAPDSLPQALVDQLKVDGIMAVPVGRGFQRMTLVRKTDKGTVTRETMDVMFVPMIKKN